MKIGIVSDSHGQADRLGRALKMLINQGAEAIVHCGDFGSTECMRVLGACGVQAYAVAGNTDRNVLGLQQVAAGAGVTFQYRSVEVDLGDGVYLAATHGHDERLMGELLAGEQFAYLCHGHTHLQRDIRIGKVRIVNPGAIERANPYSAALLDTETDELTFIEGF